MNLLSIKFSNKVASLFAVAFILFFSNVDSPSPAIVITDPEASADGLKNGILKIKAQ